MFGPLISVLAVILGLVLVGPINPANADEGEGGDDDCVPTDAVPASFSAWAFDSYTPWQTSATPPADPDGQDGDDNPLNLLRLGAHSEQDVVDSGSHWVYYTGSGDGSVSEADALWSSSNPGGAWVQYDQRTVTDQAAYDEVIVDSPAVAGQHYSLKGKSKTPKDGVPATPLVNPSIWQANTTQEPHLNGNDGKNIVWYPDPNATSGLHYASHGSKGLRDWFYYTAPVPEVSHTEHHDAVTHDEFKFRKMVEGGSHTEHRWAIEKRTYTPGTDGNTCNPETPEQPDALTRPVQRSESSCKLGGVHTWTDVYTTPFVWDDEAGEWVPGTETGPVAQDDVFTAYTLKQLQALKCVDVQGEQAHEPKGHQGSHHPTTHPAAAAPEVKGEQAAVVPTEVEAGLAGVPAGQAPAGGSSNLPLWALSLGAGMFLIGAGRLRRNRGEVTR